jgi:hypothetical protein
MIELTVGQEPQGTPADPQGSPATDPQGSPSQEPQGAAEDDWQAVAKKWESRAKKDAARLAQLESRVKTLVEPEAVADKDRALADAQAEAGRARLDALRYRIAAETGLPITMAPRLLGDDEDALRTDAKNLAESLAPPKPPKRIDAGRGTTDSGAPQGTSDPNALLRQMLGGGA